MKPFRRLFERSCTFLQKPGKMVAGLQPSDISLIVASTPFDNHFYNVITGRIPERANFSRRSVVDIIIPVYNAIELTEACISSVLKNSDHCRLILVNDASSDRRVNQYLNSVSSIPEKNLEVIVRHNEENLGFLKTVNNAYNITIGHFVILNSDTEVPPYWLDRLFAPIITAPDSVASVTPFSNTAMGWLGCNFPDPEQDNEIFKEMNVVLLDSFFANYSIDTPIEIFSGGGFCMAFNRTVVEKIGLFDDAFGRGYCEEVDWSLRAYDAGYSNVLSPNLFVYHKHGASFDQHEKQNLQRSNLAKLQSKHVSQMERLNTINSKKSTKSIRDTIAIIADAHTKGNDRWMAVVGGDRSYWDLIKDRLENSNNYENIRGFAYISFVSYQQSLQLHLYTPVQERVIYLHSDTCNYLHKILSLLGIDIAVILENAIWPESFNMSEQLSLIGCPYELIQNVNLIDKK